MFAYLYHNHKGGMTSIKKKVKNASTLFLRN